MSQQFKREDQEGAELPRASQQAFTSLGEIQDTRVDYKHSTGIEKRRLSQR